MMLIGLFRELFRIVLFKKNSSSISISPWIGGLMDNMLHSTWREAGEAYSGLGVVLLGKTLSSPYAPPRPLTLRSNL